MNDEKHQLIETIPTENEHHEPKLETFRNPEISQDTTNQISPKTPENNPEIGAQEAEEIVETRSEKYNLRPNP